MENLWGEKNLINSLLPKGLDIYLQVTIQVTEHTKTFFFYIRQSFHNLWLFWMLSELGNVVIEN